MGLYSLFWRGTTVYSEKEKRVRDDSGRKFGQRCLCAQEDINPAQGWSLLRL